MNSSKTNKQEPKKYGIGDTSFQAAGGESGVSQLVNDFYEAMDSRSSAKQIRDMHPENLDVSRDKFFRFLCGWLGGPKLYQQKYGGISIPTAHHKFNIGIKERDDWLCCMKHALNKQPYEEDFKKYLLDQLAIPAERCRTKD
jgi:hemoglobin